jgi:hypothetical protein
MAWDAFAHAEVLLTQPLMVVIDDKPGGFAVCARRVSSI